MIGLTSLEVFNSIFNILEEKNKFELHKFPDEKAGGFSCTKVSDEIERDLDVSDTTAATLQDDIIAPKVFVGNREQITKRMEDDGYMNIFQVIPDLYFKSSKVISEQKLIWLKMLLDWL